MAVQVQFRRGTKAQHDAFTGATAEVTVNTTDKTLVVHDGTTQGGFTIARADGTNLDLTGLAGVTTVTSVAIHGGTINNTTIGIGTSANGNFTNVKFVDGQVGSALSVGAATTFKEMLVVNGDARVTGILTVGTSSIIIDGDNEKIIFGGSEITGDGNINAATGIATYLTVDAGTLDAGANLYAVAGVVTTLTSTNATTADLNVTADARVGSALTVTGAVDVDGNATFAGTIDVDGQAIFDDITVSAASTFTGAIDANGGANIAGGLVANSVQVSDLTDNRVVLAGTSGELEDSGNLTFDGTTLAVTGNQTISGTIDVDGQAIFDDITVSAASTFTGAIDANGGANISGGETVLSSATVSDLTDNRVVLAGASGALEDSANLTFDGVTLAVTGNQTVSGTIDVDGQAIFDDITVSAASTFTGAVDMNGGLDVSGAETVLSSATVSDLTSGRVVLAGTSGAIEDSANLTFNGTTLSAPTADLTNATIDNLTFTSGTAITSVDTDLSSVSASDDTLASAKAIKTYVDAQVTAQDLDFAGGTGTGAVDLDSQTLTIAGTTNEIETSASGQTLTIGLPNDVTIGQDLTIGRDVIVGRNLSVTGNVTIGGTSATIFAEELTISNPDITLGFRTDPNTGNEISNDTTADHGGVAVASTEGTPLVSLYNPGIGESAPATYKKFMWFKTGAFSGLGTDAWLANYAVGVGSTQVPNGVVLAAGAVNITNTDISYVRDVTIARNSTVGGTFGVTGQTTLTGLLDANGGATIDNIRIGVADNNEIDTSSGNLTIDSAGGTTTIDDILSVSGNATFSGTIDVDGQAIFDDITVSAASTFTGLLDANGGATIDNIRIGVAGNNEIDTATGNLTIDSAGGTTTIDDALTVTGNATFNGTIDVDGQAIFDDITVSAASTFTGNVTMNANLDLQDNDKILLGTGDDLEIYHDGSNSYVSDAGSGQLRLRTNQLRVQNTLGTETLLSANQDGNVGLYYDAGLKLETTSTGINVTGSVTCDGITCDGAFSQNDGVGALIVRDNNNTGATVNAYIEGQDSNGVDLWRIGQFSNSTEQLYVWNSQNAEIRFGTNDTVRAYVDASGHFKPATDDTYDLGTSSLEWRNGYFDGTVNCDQLDVDGTIDIAGDASFFGNVDLQDNDRLRLGSGDDLQIYHDGTHSYIDDAGTGTLHIRGSQINIDKYTGEASAKFKADGNVELYYDNSKKFETASGGVTITGTATATQFDATSDIKLKENVTTIENGLDKVSQLRGVEFDFKSDGKHSLGVIAQEVEEVLPDLVSEMEDGTKTVAYANLTAVLIEAVKELKAEVAELRSRLDG